jgi:hypothetical protein
MNAAVWRTAVTVSRHKRERGQEIAAVQRPTLRATISTTLFEQERLELNNYEF